MDGISELSGFSAQHADLADRLGPMVEQRLQRIRRMHFTLGGAVERGNGAVELTFERKNPIMLAVGADGESLRIVDGAWVDPFAPPLSDENEQWIATHGKWDVFDASEEPEYSGIVGGSLSAFWSLKTRVDRLCGVRLHFTNGTLDVVCNGDEVFVYLPNDLKLAREYVYVGGRFPRAQ